MMEVRRGMALSIDPEKAPTKASAFSAVWPSFTNTNLHTNPREQIGDVVQGELVGVVPYPKIG